MANLELQIISNIIKSGDLRELQKQGISPALFQTEEAQDMYRWILEEYTDPRHPGHVPSLERTRRHYPEFDYCPTRDALSVLVNDLISGKVTQGIRELTEEMDALLQDGEDPQSILQSYLPELRDLSLQGGTSSHLLLSQAADIFRQDWELMRNSGGITGVPFPWAPLNKATAGMHDEDFIVVYGRPKNMKTWIACAIAAFAYSYANRRVLIYSKEMSDKIMARRVASIIAEVDYNKLKTGELHEDDAEDFFETLERLGEWEQTGGGRRRASMSFISDRKLRGRKGATVDMIAAEAEKFEADLVLVDGFYLMRDGRTGQRSRDWKQISNISSDLKDMAQHLQVPVIGTTQANRSAVGTHGDDLAELGFADAIGQDADLIARVFKGKNLRTGKPKVLLTFPGVRDAVLNPFVVNAWPGVDFSLLQSNVNVEAFLNDKKASDEEEDAKAGKGTKSSDKRFNPRKKASETKKSARLRLKK